MNACRSTSRIAWHSVGAAMVLAFLLSCSPQTDTPQTGTVSFDALLDQYADVIDALPEHPRAAEMIASIGAAAAREGRISSPEAREELMGLFPDGNIGLYLFHESCAKSTDDERLALCKRVTTIMPDSAVGVAAFSEELALLEERDPSSFLRTCEELLGSQGSDKKTAVALLRRAGHYRAQGKEKRAALDYLRFWARWPEKVEKMGLAFAALATLRKAGFLLEEDLLRNASMPGEMAQCLLTELEPASLSEQGQQEGAPPSCVAAYFRYAPDSKAVLDAIDVPADVERLEPLPRALFFARMGRLALNDLDTGSAYQCNEAFSTAVSEYLAEAARDPMALVLLALCCQTGTQKLLMVSGASLYVNGSDDERLYRSTARLPKLIAKLNDLYLDSVEAAQRARGEREPETFATAVGNYVNTSQSLNDRKAVVKAYRRFVDAYPDSQQAAEFLMKTAEFYENVMKTPQEAAETYRELAEKHPDSPEALIATVKRGLNLYETQRYDEAYELAQLFLAEHPDSDEIAVAKFVSALCEAALGAPEEAELHMMQLADDHPQKAIAARALYWVASTKLSRQKYDQAQEILFELVDRYPDSEYAGQARVYIERLSQISTKAGI